MSKSYNLREEADQTTEDILVVLKNLIKAQVTQAPDYGSIDIKLIYHNGELRRVITNNEVSLNFSSDRKEKIGEATL